MELGKGKSNVKGGIADCGSSKSNTERERVKHETRSSEVGRTNAEHGVAKK